MRLPSACLLAVLVGMCARGASAAELPKEMDALVTEGKRWFRESGNTDLGVAERNSARVKAWKSLWPAKEALDRFEEENPGDMDQADAKYGEIRMMVHWLKKEAPIGLLESTGVGPRKGEDEPDPEPAVPAAAGGAPAPAHAPAPDPSPKPSPAGTAPGSPPAPSAASPPPAQPPKPAAPQAPTALALLAAAEDYEKKHRFDLSGIQVRYVRVLSAIPDLSDPVARKAAEKAGEIEGRLKDGYRLLRNEDPDSLKGLTNVRIKGMVIAVARDLLLPDAATREHAARTIGLLSNPEGVYYLRNALAKEAETAPAEAMAEALVLIGGARSAEALGNFRDDPRQAGRALSALVRLSNRNPVDRRITATQLARFAGTTKEDLFDRMFETLHAMGSDGTPGLVAALDQGAPEQRVLRLVGELSATDEPAVARVLSRYFREGRPQDSDDVREAAMAAVRTMAGKGRLGDEVIPYLFHAVRDLPTRDGTTRVLNDITGWGYTVKEWGMWSNRWLGMHPNWKDDGKWK